MLLIPAIVFGAPKAAGMGVKVVADSATHVALPNASVFDCRGKAVGMTDDRGRIPHAPSSSYPLTVRYIGYNDLTVESASASDTLFLSENFEALPEVMVETTRKKVFHILAYVREYSTLSTNTDTVFLFREKMVDYMIVPDRKIRFNGWTSPRVLTSRSYYRFTNDQGLDSVSDKSNHHFSWSDWIGIVPARLPRALSGVEEGVDTLHGKYSPVETWRRDGSRVSVEVDVLASGQGRRWVPNITGFFRKNLEFDNFRVRYDYDNVAADSILASDISGYSFNIESNGRGHDMFRFNRHDEPFYVSTSAEVYILDRELIPVKEARKWAGRKFNTEETGIFEPMAAPALSPEIIALIYRVNSIDSDRIRLDMIPDQRLISKTTGRNNFRIGQRALSLLKMLTGVTYYKSRKNIHRNWKNSRLEWLERNNKKAPKDKEE